MITYTNLNIFSSGFFLTNTYRLHNKPNHHWYYYAFLLLTCSSTLHHAYPDHMLMNYIDKVAAYAVIYQGWKPYYKYIKSDSKNVYSVVSAINVTTCVTVIWLYVYGYYANKYSFDQTGMANVYHVGMHALSSIGHHAIIGTCLWPTTDPPMTHPHTKTRKNKSTVKFLLFYDENEQSKATNLLHNMSGFQDIGRNIYQMDGFVGPAAITVAFTEIPKRSNVWNNPLK